MEYLKGKTAIITGAGRSVLGSGKCGSIGYGIATAYAKKGANLVITGRNVTKLEDAKEELFRELSKDYISGITFSGGDPLHPANSLEVKNFMEEIKEKYPDKTIWLYTGSDWEDIWQMPLMQYVDVCVDGEFKIELKDTKLLWKGSSNQRVIDVRATLKQENKKVPVLHCGNYK